MARRIGSRPQAVSRPRGLRGQLVDALRARAAKLPTVAEFYDFGPQRDQLADRIAALEAGADAPVQRYELPDAALAAFGVPSRFDRTAPKLWRLVGDHLVADALDDSGPVPA